MAYATEPGVYAPENVMAYATGTCRGPGGVTLPTCTGTIKFRFGQGS